MLPRHLLKLAVAIDISAFSGSMLRVITEALTKRMDEALADNQELESAATDQGYTVEEFIKDHYITQVIAPRINTWLQQGNWTQAEELLNTPTQADPNVTIGEDDASFKALYTGWAKKFMADPTFEGVLGEDMIKAFENQLGRKDQNLPKAENKPVEDKVFSLSNSPDMEDIIADVQDKIVKLIDSERIPELKDSTPEMKDGLKEAMKVRVEADTKDIKDLVQSYNNKTLVTQKNATNVGEFKKFAAEFVVYGIQGTNGKYINVLKGLIGTFAGIAGSPEEAANEYSRISKQLGSNREAIKQINSGAYSKGEIYFNLYGSDLLFTAAGKRLFLDEWGKNITQAGAGVSYAFFNKVKSIDPEHPGLDKEKFMEATGGLAKQMKALFDYDQLYDAAVGATGARVGLLRFIIDRNLGRRSENEFVIVGKEGPANRSADLRTVLDQMVVRNLFFPMKEKNSYNRWDMIINPAGFSDITNLATNSLDVSLWDIIVVAIATGQGAIAKALQPVINFIEGSDMTKMLEGAGAADMFRNYDRTLAASQQIVNRAAGATVAKPSEADTEGGDTQ